MTSVAVRGCLEHGFPSLERQARCVLRVEEAGVELFGVEGQSFE